MVTQNSLFGSAPFFRIALAFMGGIALGCIFPNTSYWIPISLFAFLSVLLLLLPTAKATQIIAQSIVLICLLIMSGFGYKLLSQKQLFDTNLPVSGYYTGRVITKTPTQKKWTKYEVKLNAVKSNDIAFKANEKIMVYISDSSLNENIRPGNQITFKGKLYEITSLNNPGEFSYKKYLLNKGIRYQSYLWGVALVDNGFKPDLHSMALNARSVLLEQFQKHHINGDEFAVLSALTLGETDYLTKQIKKGYINSGAMHVLSVSGLHVGIIYLLISFLLKPIGTSKRSKLIRFLILFVFLWSYAFITGLSASVLRSSTMFSFVLIGESFGRRTNIYNSIAASALFLCLIDPNVVTDVGFQLSYTALLGIVFFQPKFKSLWSPKTKIVGWLWDLVTVSLAAQIGTFPIALYYFHQFPNYFLLSNFAVIPLSTVMLYGAVLFFIVSWLPFLPDLIAYILIWTTKALNFSVGFIDNLPYSTTENIWFSRPIFCLLILLIIITAFLLHYRKAYIFITLLSCILVLAAISTIENIQTLKQQVLVFYGGNNPAISIILGKEHYFYTPTDSLPAYTENLITNSSGYYKTTEAKQIESEINATPSIRLYQHQLFVKNLLIKIENNSKKQIHTDTIYDLIWNVKDLKTQLNKRNTISYSNLNDNDLQSNYQNTSTNTFELKKHGALVLNF